MPNKCTQDCRSYYAIFHRLFKRRLCRECVGRKVSNSWGVNLCWNCLRLVTWLEPMIQSNNQYLVSSQRQKYKQPWWALDLSLWYGHVILVSRYIVLSNIKLSKYQGNAATILFFKVLVWGWHTDVHTDSHMITKMFQIDGLQNFLRYCTPLVCPSIHVQYTQTKSIRLGHLTIRLDSHVTSQLDSHGVASRKLTFSMTNRQQGKRFVSIRSNWLKSTTFLTHPA